MNRLPFPLRAAFGTTDARSKFRNILLLLTRFIDVHRTLFRPTSPALSFRNHEPMVRIHKCEPMRLLSAARKIRIGADNWIYFLCTDFSSSSVFRTSRLDAKISFTRITIRISVLGPLGPLTARRVHSYAARISRTSFYLADLSASWSHMILRSALAALREWINRTYARGSALPRLTIHNSADG